MNLILTQWRHYYAGVHAIIYVVDSFDRARAPEARQELHGIHAASLSRHRLVAIGCPVLAIPLLSRALS